MFLYIEKIINKLKKKKSKEEQIQELFYLIFKDDFITEVSDTYRHRALKNMAMSESIVTYLRSEYTRLYKTAIFDRIKCPSQYELGVFAGRVIAYKKLLDDMKKVKKISEQDYQKQLKMLRAKQDYFSKGITNFSEDLIKNPV